MTLSGTEVRKSQTEKLLKLNYVQKLILENYYVYIFKDARFIHHTFHPLASSHYNIQFLFINKNHLHSQCNPSLPVRLWLFVVALWKQRNESFSRFFAVSWVYLHFSCSKGNERKCFMCYLRKADCISLIHPYSGLPIEMFSYLGSLNAAFLIQSHAMNRKGAKIVFWKEPKFYYKRACKGGVWN